MPILEITYGTITVLVYPSILTVFEWDVSLRILLINTVCIFIMMVHLLTSLAILSSGILSYGRVVWSVIDDELRTPHEGILICIGSDPTSFKVDVIDWKKFDWDGYRECSREKLDTLVDVWIKDTGRNVDVMVNELNS